MTSRLSPVWTSLTDFRPLRGEGVWLYDESGRRCLDFTSGIGVTSTGHCHPRVVEAIQRQAGQLLFAQINTAASPVAESLARLLDEVTPAGLDSFFFSNSGAEAVEAAVKLARHATGRNHLVVFSGSFHGRTHQAMAMTTSKPVYRHRYDPLPGGVFVAPFPYAHRFGWSEEETVAFCLAELERLLASQSAPDETAALVIEPVLGEGGYVPAPAAFLQRLRELCDETGMLLVLDEVQTGFGRTGAMFCMEHAGIVPDILVMAKGMGSGLPISAIGASRALMERWEKGTHGGTYGGGSAVALAAAAATIATIVEEDLAGNARRQGERLLAELRRLSAESDRVSDVRGLGLMVGVEFKDASGRPDRAAAKAVQAGCLERGLLLLTCGTFDNVIRWIPPLVVSDEELDIALQSFGAALDRLVETRAARS